MKSKKSKTIEELEKELEQELFLVQPSQERIKKAIKQALEETMESNPDGLTVTDEDTGAKINIKVGEGKVKLEIRENIKTGKKESIERNFFRKNIF